ncbi:MAG: serine/threonine-protein kinase PknK, partial [Myxococcota bacterium]
PAASGPTSEPLAGPALITRLREQPGTAGAQLRAWASRKQRRVLLFVDQFEELYTQGADSELRATFIRCLAGVADDASSPLRVITTLRSDFLDRAIHERGQVSGRSMDASRGLLFVPPMSRLDLRLALIEPIRASGYRLDSPDLVEDMLDAVEDMPGALPLLQFTASKLWDGRDRERRKLTRASYDAMGGMAGALASHADAVLAGMTAAERELARAVFERLVTPERARAIVTVGELRQLAPRGDDRAAIERVVHHLADARLLTIEDSREGGQTRASAAVELIHESLITRWPTLGRWLDENQDDAEFLARLRAASQEWQRSGQSEGMLWRGEVAEEARRWHGQYAGELGERERHYLAAVEALARRSGRLKRFMIAGGVAFV